MSHHSARWRRMVRAIKKKGGAVSPYAVATSKLGASLLKNPPPRRKIKALKLATRLAYRIYKEVKDRGYAIPIPKRTPVLVKKYIKMILDANGIKWTENNPLSRKETTFLARYERAAQRAERLQRKLGKPGLALYYEGRRNALSLMRKSFGHKKRKG